MIIRKKLLCNLKVNMYYEFLWIAVLNEFREVVELKIGDLFYFMELKIGDHYSRGEFTGVILETDGGIHKIQKRALFLYKKI